MESFLFLLSSPGLQPGNILETGECIAKKNNKQEQVFLLQADLAKVMEILRPCDAASSCVVEAKGAICICANVTCSPGPLVGQ